MEDSSIRNQTLHSSVYFYATLRVHDSTCHGNHAWKCKTIINILQPKPRDSEAVLLGGGLSESHQVFPMPRQ